MDKTTNAFKDMPPAAIEKIAASINKHLIPALQKQGKRKEDGKSA